MFFRIRMLLNKTYLFGNCAESKKQFLIISAMFTEAYVNR